MVLVYLKDGRCVEVANAVRAEEADGNLVCFDADSAPIATFAAAEVTAFTADDQTAALLKDEACTELEVLEADGTAEHA
ncbi:MAG TPA: hypothetical protein VNN10_14965 [Dehalococcoidia bacterium]|nr:hypothetical protein [Dehalococcoidia bacterium]